MGIKRFITFFLLICVSFGTNAGFFDKINQSLEKGIEKLDGSLGGRVAVTKSEDAKKESSLDKKEQSETTKTGKSSGGNHEDDVESKGHFDIKGYRLGFYEHAVFQEIKDRKHPNFVIQDVFISKEKMAVFGIEYALTEPFNCKATLSAMIRKYGHPYSFVFSTVDGSRTQDNLAKDKIGVFLNQGDTAVISAQLLWRSGEELLSFNTTAKVCGDINPRGGSLGGHRTRMPLSGKLNLSNSMLGHRSAEMVKKIREAEKNKRIAEEQHNRKHVPDF